MNDAKKYYIDPPSGWLYGFPKKIPKSRLNDVTNWLIEKGYPESNIVKMGKYFIYRIIEK
jgi:hypothetical protein